MDGELYLPKEWTGDKKRMNKAGVPKDKWAYKTRHTTFLELLERHGRSLPHKWVTGDDELGRPIAFRRTLHTLGEQYMLAVPCNTKINVLGEEPPNSPKVQQPSVRSSIQIMRRTASQPEERWIKIDVRDTEKGPLILELLKCQVETGRRSKAGIATEMAIIIRYKDRDHSIVKQDYYLSNAAVTTSDCDYARVAKAEHRIEECFDRGKGEAGMGDYEVRNWIGWQHHQTLSLIASWFLNVETRRAEKKDPRDHFQSSESCDRIRDPQHIRMRFTPRRRGSGDTATPKKPTREVVPLA